MKTVYTTHQYDIHISLSLVAVLLFQQSALIELVHYSNINVVLCVCVCGGGGGVLAHETDIMAAVYTTRTSSILCILEYVKVAIGTKCNCSCFFPSQ